MATEKTDFLKFNAYSMKELITRKMSEDSKFTDQIYEGSNLAILIDLVAYMYQVLMYQLNNAAAESMFSDTQIYENINRLVKLIGYHPRGCKTAQFQIYIQKDSNAPMGNLIFPMFSRLDTGLTDSRGNEIYFSLFSNETVESEQYHSATLYNGQFKLYPEIFTASGTENEIFTLSQIESNSENESYVDNDHFKVLIKRGDEFIGTFHYDNEELLIDPYPNIQGERLTLYTADSQVYSIRMNENKQYELKFGNGITAQKLNKNDKIYVFYLDTNGLDGEIDVGSVDWTDKKFEHSAAIFGLQKTDYENIFGINSITTNNPILDENNATKDDLKQYYQLLQKNQTTTKPKEEEDVEQIKENAPSWFKTGNRLLTRNDYETFVKKNNSDVIDVKCMNNWEYLATFFKWLYNCGLRYHQNDDNPGRHYFDETVFLKNNLPMVDAADANNIYLWVKTKNESTINELTDKLNDDGIQNVKILTSEIQVLKPIPVIFDICASYSDMVPVFADFETFFTDATLNSYLEITLDENCIYVNSYIKNKIIKIFNSYFNINNIKLGQNINNNEILDQIYSINGVSRVRTVYNPEKPIQGFSPRALDGISFITYTGSFIDTGEDVNVSNSMRHIEDFQVPEFVTSSLQNLESRIKVIKKQLVSMSSVKF